MSVIRSLSGAFSRVVGSDEPHQYDAFISYSRQDIEFARKLERALEKYRPPKGLDAPRRYLNAFRDEGDLTGAEYFEAIDRHLRKARKLIVICSPAARASEYVNDEIKRFVAARGAEHVIPIIVAGRPNNEVGHDQQAEKAFPESLCETLEMPLAGGYLDFDVQRDKVDHGRFANPWYALLANIYDLSRDELERRDLLRRRRRRLFAIGTTAVVMAVLIGSAWWAQRERAKSRDVMGALMNTTLERIQEQIEELFATAEADILTAAAQIDAWGPNADFDRKVLRPVAEAQMVHNLNAQFLPLLASREALSSLMVAHDSGFEYLALEMPTDTHGLRFYNRVVRERGAPTLGERLHDTPHGCVNTGDRRAPAFEMIFNTDQTGRPIAEHRPSNWSGEGPGRLLITSGEARADESRTSAFGQTWDGYDVYCRAWYVRGSSDEFVNPDADRLNEATVWWTEPLVFFATKDPGMTAAVRVPFGDDQLVLAFDYTLTDLSMITTESDMGAGGGVLLLTEGTSNGAPLVVALPRFEWMKDMSPEERRAEIRKLFSISMADRPDRTPDLPSLGSLRKHNNDPLIDPIVQAGILDALNSELPDSMATRQISGTEDYWVGVRRWSGVMRSSLSNEHDELVLYIVVYAREER
jgi:hypothetical protein